VNNKPACELTVRRQRTMGHLKPHGESRGSGLSLRTQLRHAARPFWWRHRASHLASNRRCDTRDASYSRGNWKHALRLHRRLTHASTVAAEVDGSTL